LAAGALTGSELWQAENRSHFSVSCVRTATWRNKMSQKIRFATCFLAALRLTPSFYAPNVPTRIKGYFSMIELVVIVEKMRMGR